MNKNSKETVYSTGRLEKLRKKASKLELRSFSTRAYSKVYWDGLHNGFTVEFEVPLNIGYFPDEDDLWFDAFDLPVALTKVGKALGGRIGSISVSPGKLVFGFVITATKAEKQAAAEGLM